MINSVKLQSQTVGQTGHFRTKNAAEAQVELYFLWSQGWHSGHKPFYNLMF